MKVRFYGRLADAIGREIELADPAGCSVGELRRRIVARHSAAAHALERSRAVIADCFVTDERLLGVDEQVEFLPPVSGG